ncbi:hypothetical protein SAMN04488109_2641 [Chryseolinea serpens]|uniref:Uncharacterized protein n=1 Tax=Chryseolinea serpens TaxID=947013 RepID=A0A1M5P2D9_9BACT|nr:hypothetical protein [Chryseolinea serpens]SHG95960.1 hypothetical protein SAMN04488109_2641 [Chryseolinea serpens]
MSLLSSTRYKFSFRPAYGSDKMLIEFITGAEREEFLPDFLDALKSFNPKLESTLDLWMNDEIQVNVNSDLGNFSLSKDIWGFAFAWADENQQCVKKISDLLAHDHRFEAVDHLDKV